MNKTWDELLLEAAEKLKALEAQVKAREQREADRVAKLTPAQRAAEEAAKRQAQQADALNRLNKKLAPAVAWLKDHDSVTIPVFASCLAGQKPNAETWTLLIIDQEDEARERFIDILQSCVGTQLQALNPEAPESKRRYPVTQLFDTAEKKALGFHAELRARWQTRPTPPSTGWQPDVDALLARLEALIRNGKTSREEFLKRGSKKALHRFYEMEFPRKYNPSIGIDTFSEYIRERGYKFGAGTKTKASQDFVFNLLAAKSPAKK